ncbi:MAG: Uma2 family endonuclease [Acidobacteria bacterium]|nr:Uma2 family endonuclease [Acidobacteriota bacterium]
MLVLNDISEFSSVVLDGPPLTDDEFLAFCNRHEEWRVESNAEGEIEIMPPPGPDTGDQNAEITFQLRAWNRQSRRGKTFDSGATFGLPGGARRAPDAAWISAERADAVARSDRGRIWHTCPEFVIELRSPSDRIRKLQRKMDEWITNGAQLGWLIDPMLRRVTVYRPGREPEVIQDPIEVEGEGLVSGFTLDLTPVWEIQDEIEASSA